MIENSFINTTIYGSKFKYLLFSCFNENDINLTWITTGYQVPDHIEYRKLGSPTWIPTIADKTVYFPTPTEAHKIHKKYISGLDADSVYEVRILGVIKTIKTPPTDNIKIAFFSDNHNTLPKRNETLNIFNRIRIQNPDIVIGGGDLTSQDGLRSINSTETWLGFLEDVNEYFVKDGHLVPFLVTTGNHEFTPFYSEQPAYKYYFDELFVFSEGENKFYGKCVLGNKLSILLLDSAHATSIENQETFIQNAISEETDFVIPIMHVSPYPSSRAVQTDIANQMYQFWFPHFKNAGISLLLDAHNHARKRTVKLYNTTEDNDGFIVIGDGASSYLRTPYNPETRWYLDVVGKENSFWLLEVSDKIYVTAIEHNGTILDYVEVERNIPTNPLQEYYEYAKQIYIDGGVSLETFELAWEHSLEVDPADLATDIADGATLYPNHETQGIITPLDTTIIGNDKFYNLRTNDKPLVLSTNLQTIGSGAFRDWRINTHQVIIPDSVTSLGVFCFRDWRLNNSQLLISNSLTESLANSAFQGWYINDKPLILPSESKYASNSTFRQWNANSHPVVFPETTERIGGLTLGSWGNIPYIQILANTPPTLDNSDAFSNQNDAPIYVPDASVTAYKTATNWVDFSNRIFSINDKP